MTVISDDLFMHSISRVAEARNMYLVGYLSFLFTKLSDVYFSSAFFKDSRLLSLVHSYKSSFAIDQKQKWISFATYLSCFYLLARYFVCDDISSLQTFISHHGC